MEIPADSPVDSGAGRGHGGAGRVRLGPTTAGFGAALLLFLGVSWFGFLSTQRLLDAARWSAHTEDVIGEVRGLLAALLDAEAAMRGFVITGDERFLDPYRPAVGEVRDRIETLRSLIRDHPGQRRRLADVEPLVAARILSIEAVLALRRERGQGAAAAAIGRGDGKGLSDRLRVFLAAMEEEERRLLVGRQRAVETSTFRTNCALFGGGALSVVLLVGIVVALQREIRAHSRAEEELRKAQVFLDSIVENIPDMIFVKEAASLRLVRLNRAGEELLGFPRADLIGKNDYDFFPRDQADFFTARDRDVLNGGTLLDIPEEPIRTRGGAERFLHTKKVPIPDQGGHPRYLLGISEDVTERKASLAQIERLNRSLREHSDRLEAANKELEAFSYSVSHDLRAPLRHISGFVDVLQAHAGPTLDERGRRCVSTIAASARRMSQLIDDLLEFSRMGRAELGRARVELGPLVTDVLRDLEGEAEGRRIAWRIGPLPDVEGDPAMLRLVFANLVSNALKYTRPRDEAQIEIGARVEDGETVIFVRDNGVGFSMEYAPRLFGVFQRLHRQEEFEGTGIGLANVRRIIHRHGGRTWAEAEVDRGAAFYFSLPQLRESA